MLITYAFCTQLESLFNSEIKLKYAMSAGDSCPVANKTSGEWTSGYEQKMLMSPMCSNAAP